MKREQISPFQFYILVFMFVVSSSTLLIPAIITPYANQDIWVVTLISAVVAIPIVWIYMALGMRCQQLTIIQYSEEILGKWMGKLISCFLIFYFLIITAGLLRQIGDMLVTLILPDTPIQWIEISFLLLIIFSIRLGIEVTARTAEIFFPWVLLFFLLLFVALLPLIELNNLRPLFEGNINVLIKGTLIHIGVPYLDLVILLMVFPYIKQQKKGKKAYLLGMLTGGSFVVVVALLSILILGVEITKQAIYPVYTLAQRVQIGNFIQRIEVLVGGIWFITLFFKIAICFYASVLGIAQVCNIDDYRPLTLPLGLIILPLSLFMFSSNTEFQEFVAEIWTISVLPYGLFIPLLLLLVARIKIGKEKRYSNS